MRDDSIKKESLVPLKKDGLGFIQTLLFEGMNVEVIVYEGEMLFNPYHCGNCLELSESAVRNHLAKMSLRQAILLKNSDILNKDIRKLNNAGEKFLKISGVYKLIFKSQKPDAEKFQDWVTDDVLPMVNTTGAYFTPDILQVLLEDPNKMKELVDKYAEEYNRRIALEEEVKELDLEIKELDHLIEQKDTVLQEQKPLVTFAKIVTTDKALIEIGVFARRISTPGRIIGRNNLFAFMRQEGILFKVKGNDNLPKQKYIDAGYFVSKPVVGLNFHGKVKDKTFITARGQYWFVDRYYKKLFTGRFDASDKEIREKQLSLLDILAEGIRDKNE